MAIGVGIIGVNAKSGWAKEGHVPAVQHLDGLELLAVASRSDESAKAAADAVGAPRSYGDPKAMIDDPDIQLITVASPVPSHRELALYAIAAGKHVMSEWPLAVTPAQAAEIAAAAEASTVRTAVGLQARHNPAVLRALEILGASDLGRILSVDVLSTTAGFGPDVPEAGLYLEDPASGMNLPTIQNAHTLDLVALLGGELVDPTALLDIQFPELRVGDDHRSVTRTIPDQVFVQAKLAGGGAASAHTQGGRSDDFPFRLEIVGTKGRLSLTGGGPRGFQAGTLALSVDGESVAVDEGEAAGLPDSVVNVAGNYAALRDDILTGSRTAPDFAHAAQLLKQIAELVQS